MYRVALVDGSFSNKEMTVLNNLCFKNNIPLEDLTKITKSDNVEIESTYPEDEENKRRYLFEIARIIIADGNIREEEIYLFNKIAKALKTKSDIDILREEIFKLVISEFIKEKEEELLKLKSALESEYIDKIKNIRYGDLIPESEHRKIVEDLIKGFKNGNYTYPYQNRVRIFIIGESPSNEREVKETVINSFKENQIEINEKDIKLCIGNYDTISNEYNRHKQSVESGEFNYLIYGAHPHSLKGRSSTSSWESYLNDTDTMIKGDHSGPLSLSKIRSFSNEFAKDWGSKLN